MPDLGEDHEAARVGDMNELTQSLERALDATDATGVEGAALALAEIASTDARFDALLSAEERCPTSMLVRRALTIRDDDAARCALRWRGEAWPQSMSCPARATRRSSHVSQP